jgi:hypothetical protein
MTRSQCIREILVDNDNLTARQIMNILIQKYPQIWNDKVAFYADAGKEKSESWVSNQLTAEIHRQILFWKSEGKITSEKNEGVNTFTATDSFKNSIKIGPALNDGIVDNSISDEYNEDECIDCEDKGGVVYFLSSDIFPDVSKIGETIDLEKRIYDLSKDNRYGVFNLKVKGWIKVKNHKEVERMFHKFFNKYRLYSKGYFDLKVDTELFKTDHNLYEMWKHFIKVNYLDNQFMKNEIIDYKF